ncbi:MAG TPA: SHOCT domain-containing protein [Methylomirabilota bacterium]|jgi:putative membrane protein|nr:SHOCT domain-containing protein [Methylomirabilota bacterium]
MFPCSGFGYGYWWTFPIIMIGMLALCFFMMRGQMGSLIRRPGGRGNDADGEEVAESALDILNKRYARGEINREEYEEKKRTITRHDGAT